MDRTQKLPAKLPNCRTRRYNFETPKSPSNREDFVADSHLVTFRFVPTPFFPIKIQSSQTLSLPTTKLLNQFPAPLTVQPTFPPSSSPIHPPTAASTGLRS